MDLGHLWEQTHTDPSMDSKNGNTRKCTRADPYPFMLIDTCFTLIFLSPLCAASALHSIIAIIPMHTALCSAQIVTMIHLDPLGLHLGI
jgi:hypothetical protein